VTGAAAAKREAMKWIFDKGVTALHELLFADAERLVGPKKRHQADRTAHFWGSTSTRIPFGGRRLRIDRPRVRHVEGHEIELPCLREFQAEDVMPERVMEQILLGVATRGYARSLEPLSASVETSGTSKSSVSRKLVAKTAEAVEQVLTRRLDEVDLVALFLDGIHVAEHAVIVALGVTAKGVKVPLGLWIGSTENAEVCTSLLQDLIERGLTIEEKVLAVIDGGKGLRRALRDVFGDLVDVQRCQIHKMRNVVAHLPERRHTYVRKTMREAYRTASATEARKKLQALASWLERNGEDGAAASLREGLEETLTIVKLGASGTLRRFFSTTNAIENLVGTIRRVSRNVKRWREGDMIRRWSALGLLEAERRFRRIKGHAQLADLVRALRTKRTGEEKSEKAA
jgi:transposase-like protein